MELIIVIDWGYCFRLEWVNVHLVDSLHMSSMDKLGFLLSDIPHCHRIASDWPNQRLIIRRPFDLSYLLIRNIPHFKQTFWQVAHIPNFNSFIRTSRCEQILIEWAELYRIGYSLMAYHMMKRPLRVSCVPKHWVPIIITGGKDRIVKRIIW
jgi:hypothetical protein